MKASNILLALVALACAFGLWYHYQDTEYRKIHGAVTQVSYFNWEQEVLQSKDEKPVLIYFYLEDSEHLANEEQHEAVRDFAWDHAGEVKVVAANVAHPDNLAIAVLHGVLRTPGFVILDGDELVRGSVGGFASADDLERLLSKLDPSAVEKTPVDSNP